jgi:hypothetical protein
VRASLAGAVVYPKPAGPTFVQAKAAGVAGPGATTVTCTFTANVTAGHLIYATVLGVSNSAVFTFSDGQSNSYTTIDPANAVANPQASNEAFTIAASSGALTVTVVAGTSQGTGLTLVIAELAGVTAVDQHNSVQNDFGAVLKFVAVTTTHAKTIVIGCTGQDANTTYAGASGWTLGTQVAVPGKNASAAFVYQIQSSTGTYTPAMTAASVNDQWHYTVAFF